MPAFADLLDPANRQILFSLDSPHAIQDYLDSLPYIGEDLNRSPVKVMQDRHCHCLDGGFLAALALRRLGHPPLVIDLVPEPGTDDDHVLALYRVDGFWGAVAKSNYSALRYREPVYRSLRELVMSYFEVFFNLERQRTLRGYTRPFNLSHFDQVCWMDNQSGADYLFARFYARPFIPVVTPKQVQALTLMDERSFQTNLYGVNLKETYQKPG
jgi:hypothetical protein